jgi:alcohol dehydrogenase YqhD (iron-dependent ADH family)
LETKLRITSLEFTPKYDDDLQHLVASIKFKALVDVKDVATLAQLQSYVNNECVISGSERQSKMEVDKDTGEIED